VRHAYAMLVVIIGWTLFRADSLGQAGHILSVMFHLTPSVQPTTGAALDRGEALVFAIALVFSTPLVPTLVQRWVAAVSERPLPRRQAPGAYVLGALAGALVLCAVTTKILMGSYSPFIYFRF
jgi:alginate O-acetyltransferase complex protein AlgI